MWQDYNHMEDVASQDSFKNIEKHFAKHPVFRKLHTGYFLHKGSFAFSVEYKTMKKTA
jgi:hypothetical protein